MVSSPKGTASVDDRTDAVASRLPVKCHINHGLKPMAIGCRRFVTNSRRMLIRVFHSPTRSICNDVHQPIRDGDFFANRLPFQQLDNFWIRFGHHQ